MEFTKLMKDIEVLALRALEIAKGAEHDEHETENKLLALALEHGLAPDQINLQIIDPSASDNE